MPERDMMQYGYYGPNMQYNFGYQGPPGSLMPIYNNVNPLEQINARLNVLENKVKALEQKMGNNTLIEDNSMYML